MARDDSGITFNSDLLLYKEDQEAEFKARPDVFFASYHKALCDKFEPIDKEANAFKKKSRAWGLAAVLLVAASIMGAAAEPFYHDSPLKLVIAGGAALAGIVGALIGVIGVYFSHAKRRWLEKRMITERMRQLHFQMLIAWAPRIAAGAADPARQEEFIRERDKRLDEFAHEYISNREIAFTSAVADENCERAWMFKELGERDAWRTAVNAASGKAMDQLIESLRLRRLKHQEGYAISKLSDDSSSFWRSPLVQVSVFASLALVCVGVLVGLDMLMLIGVLASIEDAWAKLLHMLTIWSAVIALALRTVEDGLRSHAEVERYEHYRSSLGQIAKRFEEEKDAAGKLTVLAQVEDLAYGEMVNFLKANKAARFVM